jgi:hypothetical protein
MTTPIEIVTKLASFKHRGISTEFENFVINYLSNLFDKKLVVVDRFSTPKTYISVIWWLLIGLILGLLFSNYFPFIGLILTFLFATFSFLYFNWYASPITKFPPQVKSHNLIVKDTINKKKKLILMAHWDTAPISFLYRPSLVGNFRISLKIALFLMLFAEFVVIVQLIYPSQISSWLSYVLIAYFTIQGIIASVDFYRLGYSNGASDNATGVAAAIETAKQLWNKNIDELEVELVLTGAEEVGMIGARDYFVKHGNEFTKETYLINFDTLGSGKLKVINQTGSWSNVVYDNKIVKIAKKIIAENTIFQQIEFGSWHTADFDSIWFQRAGMPCVTLAALDTDGKMPNIHRPTDTLNNVDFNPMFDAIKLAVQIADEL